MNPAIEAALIGSATTLAIAAVPAVWAKLNQQRKMFPITSERQRAIAGSWVGTGGDRYVENGAALKQASMEVYVSFRFRTVTARVVLNVDQPVGYRSEVVMTGGFASEDLIHLTYVGTDIKRRQSGVALLRLAGDGNRLTGHYAGFSPTRECLIVGDLNLFRSSAFVARHNGADS